MTTATIASVWTEQAPYEETGGFSEEGFLTTITEENPTERVWRELFTQLVRVGKLEDDWDNEGAEAPTSELIESAEEFLIKQKTLNPKIPPTRVTASPSGAVIVEWQQGKLYLEAEIFAPYVANFMLERANEMTTHWEGSWASEKQGSPEVIWETHYEKFKHASGAGG